MQYTIDQAADMAGINPVTIRRYIQRGIIKPSRKGRRYMLSTDDLQKIPKKGITSETHVAITNLVPVANLEPMQDLLSQINQTFLQFSQQNATTAQGIAQEYSRSVRPIVQCVTGQVEPETGYEKLKAEMLEFLQKPIHRIAQNVLLIRKAIKEQPELQDMCLSDALDWFIKNMFYGLDQDGFNIPENVKQSFKEAVLAQQQE